MWRKAFANHSFAADFPVCYIQWREEPKMSLAEKIQKDLVDAMRAKEELRLSVLRGIKAAIKHKEVEKMRALDEAESIQILQTLVKQRKESIEQFTRGTARNSPAKKPKNSPSSNLICLPAPARPKWTRRSPRRFPNPARIPSSRWARL